MLPGGQKDLSWLTVPEGFSLSWRQKSGKNQASSVATGTPGRGCSHNDETGSREQDSNQGLSLTVILQRPELLLSARLCPLSIPSPPSTVPPPGDQTSKHESPQVTF